MSPPDESLRQIGERAAAMISAGDVVGLGTGHAATAFLHALGERVREGLPVRGVATSQTSAELAQQLGITLTTLDENPMLDIDVDGADEVDPMGNLIKGYGGALVREKIVARSSRQLVILVGPEKLVDTLGAHGKLPVEIIPFGEALCQRELRELGFEPRLRLVDGHPYVTDNGNHILDCGTGLLRNAADIERQILEIPGVVGTGLFLGMGPTVLIQTPAGVEVREPADQPWQLKGARA